MDNQIVRSFPRLETVFDGAKDAPHHLLHSHAVSGMLQKLLPPDFFFAEDGEKAILEEFSAHLPLIKWRVWGEKSGSLSIFLVCKYRVNAAKFFYEMVSRWLLPGKRLRIASYFATDFHLPDLSGEAFLLSEIVIALEPHIDIEKITHQLSILESEIRLGLVSVYHASRILEIKGLTADEKTALIQERISSLLERRPSDFEHDIFAEMQHFLVMCSEEFKAIREYTHMSRIIYVFYLFRKGLKKQIETHSGQRFISIRLSRTYLHLPFGLKRVVGVFIGLNLHNQNELFDSAHFEKILATHFPHLHLIEDSFFSLPSKEERVHLFYLELEKAGGEEITLSELKEMKSKLPDEIRNGIEKLTRPVFMPRNEEEVMRNIITLSNQLKFSRDLPQVIIAFDEQKDVELLYTVIWVRVQKPSEKSLQELYEQSGGVLSFSLDRIRKVGMLRKKYPKEATVFRLALDAAPFLRPDHSIDLFKARQAVVQELNVRLGEFRDYNGGMIAKQHEQFLALKALFAHLDGTEEMLLENFFHSIFPIELRSLFNPILLKKLFTLLLDSIRAQKEGRKEGMTAILKDEQCAYFLLSSEDPALKERVMGFVENLQIPSSQLLTIKMQALETSYLGFIYREIEKERREIFLNGISYLTESLTFASKKSY